MLWVSRCSGEQDSRKQRGAAAWRRALIRVASTSLLSWVALSQCGCAGTFLFADDADGPRYRHRELGYEIDYPSVLSRAGWQIQQLDESDLLVRHRDGSAWAIASNCRATVARVETLAAELARAMGGRALEPGRPIVHAGLEGWSQRLESSENGDPIDVKTVTLRGPRCTYDWILLAPNVERLDALEADFDAWWQSFEPGPGDRVPEADE